jgi:hypothetical protein
MAAKLKVDQLESVDGSTNITLNNSITMAATKTLPAASLTGTLPAISGASLTSLTAANLTGTIADARFPATLPAASAANLTAVPAANITGTLPAIDGSNLTGVSGGKVLQVVSSTTSATPHTTSATYVDTGVTLNITPSATSSKILVTVTAHIDKYTGSNANSWNGKIMRDSTQIISQTGLLWTNTSTYNGGGLAMSKLDSPSTTSQITYKLQQATTNSGYTVGLRGGGETITAIEIGA